MALLKSGCRRTVGNAHMINEVRAKMNFQGVCVVPRIYGTTIKRIKMNVHHRFASVIKMIGLHCSESIVRMAIIEATMAHHLLGVLHTGGQIENPDDSGIPEVHHSKICE